MNDQWYSSPFFPLPLSKHWNRSIQLRCDANSTLSAHALSSSLVQGNIREEMTGIHRQSDVTVSVMHGVCVVKLSSRQETVITRQSQDCLLGTSVQRMYARHLICTLLPIPPPKGHRLRLRIPSMYCLASMPIPSANLPGFHPLLGLDPSFLSLPNLPLDFRAAAEA